MPITSEFDLRGVRDSIPEDLVDYPAGDDGLGLFRAALFVLAVDAVLAVAAVLVFVVF